MKLRWYYLFFLGFFLNFSSWGLSPLGDLNCGQRGQLACGITSNEFWKVGSCDEDLEKLGLLCVSGKNKVEKDSWIPQSLDFQRSLTEDLPLNKTTFFRALGSETSINRQDYGLTDLLNLGVRSFSVEVNFNSDILRVCSIDCSEKSRPWFAWLEELSLWIRKNPLEILLIDIVDKVDDKKEELQKPIEFHFSHLLFRPSMKKEEWPSHKSLREKDQRIVFFNNRSYGKDLFHLNYFISHEAKNWDGKNCILKEKKFSEIMDLNKEAWLGFEDIFDEEYEINPEVISEASRCPVTLFSLVHISKEKMEAGIWSWDKDWPKKNKEETCTFIDKSGNWKSSSCDEKRNYACQSKSDPSIWKITNEKDIWEEGERFCDDGFGFSKPLSGYFNNSLSKLIKNDSGAWLKQLVNMNEWQGHYVIIPSISGRPLIGWYKNVRQWSWLNKAFQMWFFVPREEGYYLIKNKDDEKCMSVAEGLTENAANIILAECDGTNGQLWKLESKGKGLYWIKNKNSQKCLDLEKTKKYNFDSVMQWSCHDVSQHKFHLLKIR